MGGNRDSGLRANEGVVRPHLWSNGGLGRCPPKYVWDHLPAYRSLRQDTPHQTTRFNPTPHFGTCRLAVWPPGCWDRLNAVALAPSMSRGFRGLQGREMVCLWRRQGSAATGAPVRAMSAVVMESSVAVMSWPLAFLHITKIPGGTELLPKNMLYGGGG